jgi:hypothetical protein
LWCCEGSNAPERGSTAAVNSAESLKKQDALDALAECSECQHYLTIRVYEYWLEKRKAKAKPLLRRLQAPTPESETNPYLVFRQRQKPNKPLTRRRRETPAESLEKISAIVENLESAIRLAEVVREREAKKTLLNVRLLYLVLC